MPFLQNSDNPSSGRKDQPPHYQFILFDLDGTLLPMDQENFTHAYFRALCRRICPYGYTPEALTEGIWKGTAAMVGNDGRKPNREVFWDVFSAVMGEEIRQLEDALDSFYRSDFSSLKTVTGENPGAAAAVKAAKEHGRTAVLATNPIFPLCAVETRLRWIGLSPGDFSYVTAYENSRYCKPNPLYYKEILSRLGAHPEDCLMIGNDAGEDAGACRRAGIDSFLVTDCLIDRGMDLSAGRKGSFSDMLRFLCMETG